MNNSVKQIVLIILCFALASVGMSNAQEPLPSMHALRSFDGILDGRIRVWSLDEQTGTVAPIVNIRQEEGFIDADFIVDVEQSELFFIIYDNKYPYLGESRLIRYDWKMDTEEIVYERRNLVAISNHPQKNRLVISYYAEDTQSVLSNTVIYSCLLDIEAQTCYEFGDVAYVIPYDWIWLDTVQALQVRQWLTIPGEIELVNIEAGNVRSVITVADEYLKFWQIVSNSADIFLLGGVKERNADGELEYVAYRLNPQTFEMTFLTSISVLEPITAPILSPDGKYLLYWQLEKLGERQDSDSVQVVDVETGEQVANFSPIISGPSGEHLVFDDFQWASDSASVLGIADAGEGQPRHVVSLDVHSGEITFLTTIEGNVRFVDFTRIR